MTDAYDHLDAGVLAERRGAIDEALEHFRAAALTDDQWLAADALRRQAVILRNRAEWDGALDLARRSAELAAVAGLRDQEAEARNAEASVWLARGDFARAKELFQAVLGITRDPRIRGLALQNLGAIGAQQGDWEAARRDFLASVRCFQEAGYERGVAIAHNNYGGAALEHGNFALAADLLAEAVASARRTEDPDLMALATMNHAEAVAGLGELDRAERLLDNAMGHFSGAGNTWRVVETLRIRGDIARRREEPELARRHYDEALRLASAIGAQAEIAQLRERLQELSDIAG